MSLSITAMSLDLRPSRTATAKPELIVGGECEWDTFPQRAQAVVDHFGMRIVQKIDGLDVRMWIVVLGQAKFCISWDTWVQEVSIMAWEDTPDAEVERLMVTGDG